MARNYAATLFELGAREGAEERFGELLSGLADAYRDDAALRHFLDAPSVSLKEKKEVLRSAFEERAPESFIRFLFVTLDRRRHGRLPGIAAAYRDLLDRRAGRVRASVTLPFEPDEGLKGEIVAALERRFEREVVPEFRYDPDILGGTIVRVGDELMDASVRRRLERMKWELMR